MARISTRSKSPARKRSSSRSPGKKLQAATKTKPKAIPPRFITNFVLDLATQKRLANWQYHSGGYTPLDIQVGRVYWKYAAHYRP